MHLRSFEGGLEIANQNGIVSPAYTILRSKAPIAPVFYYAYFRSYEFVGNKLRTAVEGIRDGKSINMDTFWNIRIPTPPISVQTYFASLFSAMDAVVNNATATLIENEKLKQYILQNMFI